MIEFVKPEKVEKLPELKKWNGSTQQKMLDLVATARASEGYWILYAVADHQSTSHGHKKSAERAGIDTSDFEWACRKREDGNLDLYIRYVPKKGKT